MKRKNKGCCLAAVFCVLMFICLWNNIMWMQVKLKAEETFIEDETDLFVPDEINVEPFIPTEQNQPESALQNKRQTQRSRQNSSKIKITEQVESHNETEKKVDSISENQITRQDDKNFHYPDKSSAIEDSYKNSPDKQPKETTDIEEMSKQKIKDVPEETNEEEPEEITGQADEETMESSQMEKQKIERTYWRYFILLGGVLLAGGTWRMILQVENNGAL